jgi:hypothetical protein
MEPNLHIAWSGEATDTSEAAMRTTRKPQMQLAFLGLVIATCFGLAGCGGENGLVASLPTAPGMEGDPADISSPGSSPVYEGITGAANVPMWYLVASGWVTPLSAAKVEGSRYSVKFPQASVATRSYITIRERDPMVADVEFGPHGTWFLFPVEVSIDYRGTANDPESPNYNGAEPAVFWYDPTTRTWEPIPFTADKKLKKVMFYLQHFSRYAMSDGTEDGEWQWTRTGKQPGSPTGASASE